MNKPFIHKISRNHFRPYVWMVKNVRGNYVKISSCFSSEDSAQKWMFKVRKEDPCFGYM